MKIIFYGNRQAGMISLLTTLALNQDIVKIWEDKGYGLPGIDFFDIKRRMINKKEKLVLKKDEHNLDLLLCVHGWRIIPKNILDRFRLGGVNLHPFLDKYPGLHPVKRAILAGEKLATVYAHKMTEKIDSGEILASESIKMPKQYENHVLSNVDVYNELYPLYAKAIAKVINKLEDKN